VDVPGEDQVGARVDERLEDVVASRDGTLAGRPPWRAEAWSSCALVSAPP
jgi:hypothetical protein